eukprot:scaffold15864_cov22-Tisochrysis_lutea.AAC.2
MTVPDNRFLAETGSGGDKEVGPFAAFQVADMYEHYLLVMSKDRNGRDPCPCWVCIGCPGALCAQVMNVLCVRFEMQECGGVLQHAEERGKQRAICCVYWGHACVACLPVTAVCCNGIACAHGRGLLRALQGIVVFGNPLCALLFKTGVC